MLIENDYYKKKYQRHFTLKEIGYKGQKKLKSSHVLVIGIGGLGSPIAMYLAAAGVGTIGIVDSDVVDYSNLQRQILYTAVDVGKSKPYMAKERLQKMDPLCSVIVYEEMFSDDNAERILSGYNIIVDATDNLSTRCAINRNCRKFEKTYVFGSIQNFEGAVTVFPGKDGPCYRCLFEDPPESNHLSETMEQGVLGALPGVIGSLQATEVIKLICNIGDPLIGRMLIYNALDMEVDIFEYTQRANCPVCQSDAVGFINDS